MLAAMQTAMACQADWGFVGRLEKAMRAHRFTPAELARRVNKSRAFISEVLGAKKMPSRRTLVLLAATLDVTTDWLATGYGDPVLDKDLGELAAQVSADGVKLLLRHPRQVSVFLKRLRDLEREAECEAECEGSTPEPRKLRTRRVSDEPGGASTPPGGPAPESQ